MECPSHIVFHIEMSTGSTSNNSPNAAGCPRGDRPHSSLTNYGCNTMFCVALVVKTVTVAVAKVVPPTHWVGMPDPYTRSL